MANFTKSIAIYYGYPSYVNQTYSVSGAVDIFSDYDIVVFGAGLENPTHPDHQNTCDIINNTTSTQFYGYINSTDYLKNIKKQIDNWECMGNIYGILADRFGFDFNITRVKQNKIINYIHNKGLCAMVNAWNPDDVFSTFNSTLDPTVLGSLDWYLAQSHYVINGEWQDINIWESKSNAMVDYNTTTGVQMACITTTTDSIDFNAHKWNIAHNAHVIYGFNASGWGEPNFSATSSLLPWRSRPFIQGTYFSGPLIKNSPVFQRYVNVGIQLDTNNNSISKIIN